MDVDAQHLDSYDKRSRPSVISLQSLQHLKSAVSKKPNLASSPEAAETNVSAAPGHPATSPPWFAGRNESIPYADE